MDKVDMSLDDIIKHQKKQSNKFKTKTFSNQFKNTGVKKTAFTNKKFTSNQQGNRGYQQNKNKTWNSENPLSRQNNLRVGAQHQSNRQNNLHQSSWKYAAGTSPLNRNAAKKFQNPNQKQKQLQMLKIKRSQHNNNNWTNNNTTVNYNQQPRSRGNAAKKQLSNEAIMQISVPNKPNKSVYVQLGAKASPQQVHKLHTVTAKMTRIQAGKAKRQQTRSQSVQQSDLQQALLNRVEQLQATVDILQGVPKATHHVEHNVLRSDIVHATNQMPLNQRFQMPLNQRFQSLPVNNKPKRNKQVVQKLAPTRPATSRTVFL